MSVDLRLFLPAVSAWIGAAILIGLPEAALTAAIALWSCAVAANGVAVAMKPSALRRRTFRGRTLATQLAVSCAGVALVASVIAAAAPARFPEAVNTAADGHLQVSATVTVGTAPKAGQSFAGSSPRITFHGTITRLDLRGDSVAVSVPALVFTEAVTDADGLAIGATVRIDGTLKQNAPGDSVAVMLFGDGAPEVVAGPPWWLGWAAALRVQFAAAAADLPGDGGDLLPGLATGDTSAVTADLDADMKASSLSHLTAVSGANCVIVIASIMLLGGLAGLRRWLRIAASLVVLAGFVVLVTPEPSVLRAAVMATIVMLGIGLGRPGRGIPALSLAVIILLAGDPWLSRSFGFVLSVLATAGLLLLAAPLTRLLRRWMPLGLAAVIAIPLSAQLACQPVLIILTPSIPLYGVPANLLAGPAAPVATVVGLIACLLVPWLPGVASGCLYVAWLPSAWIAAVARACADLPGSRLPWWGGIAGVLAILAVTGLIIALTLRRPDVGPTRWSIAATAVLITAFGVYSGALVGAFIGRAVSFPSDWQVAACDIGQGDAVVVRDGDLHALIDVGPDPQPLTECLDTLGVDRIDLLVLTHYDLDHIGGIDAVIGRVDAALVGAPENAQDAQLHERLIAGGATVAEAHRGDTGTLGGLRWDVLWPDRGSGGAEHGDMQSGNAGSVTVEFDGRGIRSLFLGDLGEESQDAMLAESNPGPVDVVKVAHHGSRDQSTRLYERLGATVGMISVGADNGYGHPTDALLELLASAGTLALRTDEQGMLVVAPAAEAGGPPGAGALTIWTERSPADTAATPGVSGPG